MKIRRLRLAGFGPYRFEQDIDFEQFDADGIFLITGKTGAGKSSILDAICFALYDSIPRYDGRDSKPRSHHCEPDDPTFVELEFVLRGETYRIYRTCEYERPSKRGDKMVTANADARIDRLDDGEWVSLAAKPRDVGLLLAEILPIKKDQFLQVILLAQNRFQQFLLAKTSERRDVLRTLFDTARFERLETALSDRRKVLDADVEATNTALAAHAATIAEQCNIDEPVLPAADWFTDARSGLVLSLTNRVEMTDALRIDVAAAEAALRQLEDLAGRQRRLNSAREKSLVLANREDEIAGARAGLDAAERADHVWPHLEAWRTAAQDEERAGVALERATAQWTAIEGPGLSNGVDAAGSAEAHTDADDAEQRAKIVEELNAVLGSLESVLLDEKDVPRLQGLVASAERRVVECDLRIGALQERASTLPGRLAEIESALTELAVLAGQTGDHDAAASQLAAAVTAAKRCIELESEVLAAQRNEVAASIANREAAGAYEHLVQSRITNMAFELAADLAPGVPCAVCGGTEHPAPAVTDAEPVTASMVDAARTLLEQRQQSLRVAIDLVREREKALGDERTKTGGKSAEALSGELAAVRERLAAARAAETRHRELVDQREAMRAESADLASTIEVERSAREAAAADLAHATSTCQAAEARVQAHRAGHGSVRDRAQQVRETLDAARTLESATRRMSQARTASEHVRRALDDQLADRRFADVEELTAARVGSGSIAALRTQIRTHDDEVAAVRSALADPDLAGLPNEPVDPSPAATSLSASRDLLDAALSAQGALSAKLAIVDRRIADATALLKRSETLLDEHRQVRELAAVMRGEEPNTKRIRLETFVLAAQLEEIIVAANRRLHTMTDNRYSLQLDDAKQYRNVETGLGLSVFDEHTGVARQTASLSGGEMFLASLSLALGLAEVVSNQAGGIRLDTLFVDEGFGSLDAETLEVAMHALDGLRSGGRSIGLISHVESMKDQIPAKLAITVNASGESSVASAFVPA